MDKEISDFKVCWGKVRKRGILLYILSKEFIAILGWWIGSLVGLILKERKIPTFSHLLNKTYAVLMGLITAGLIGSFLWWFLNEKRYNEIVRNEESDV